MQISGFENRGTILYHISGHIFWDISPYIALKNRPYKVQQKSPHYNPKSWSTLEAGLSYPPSMPTYPTKYNIIQLLVQSIRLSWLKVKTIIR